MSKKSVKILTLSAFLLAASGVNAQQSTSYAKHLNATYRSHISSNMALSRSQILDFFTKGTNAMNVDISQFKTGSMTGMANPTPTDMNHNNSSDINGDINSSQSLNESNSLNQSSSDVNQDRDFTQDERTTNTAGIQDPKTIKNSSEQQAFGDNNINAENSTSDTSPSLDANKAINNSMNNSSAESNTVRQDFTLEPKTDTQQATDINKDNNTNTTTNQTQTKRVRLAKD